MRTAAILFDIDDTIVPSSAAYDSAMEIIGIPPDSEEFLAARSAVKSKVPPGYPAGRSRLLYFKAYLEIRREFRPDRLLKLMDNYENAVLDFLERDWQEKSRIQFFTELSRQNILFAFVTNETLRMQSLKLNRLFSEKNLSYFLVTSEETGREKPDSNIFTYALSLLNLSPVQCLGVGDSVDMDMQGFSQIGVKAALTTEYRNDKKDFAGIRLTQLEDLLKVVST